MRQFNATVPVHIDASPTRERSALRRLFSVVILLGVVTTALSGCIVVPFGGWGDGGYHHHGHYRHY